MPVFGNGTIENGKYEKNDETLKYTYGRFFTKHNNNNNNTHTVW